MPRAAKFLPKNRYHGEKVEKCSVALSLFMMGSSIVKYWASDQPYLCLGGQIVQDLRVNAVLEPGISLSVIGPVIYGAPDAIVNFIQRSPGPHALLSVAELYRNDMRDQVLIDKWELMVETMEEIEEFSALMCLELPFGFQSARECIQTARNGVEQGMQDSIAEYQKLVAADGVMSMEPQASRPEGHESELSAMRRQYGPQLPVQQQDKERERGGPFFTRGRGQK